MSNELKKIVKAIQFKTDKTIEEIATEIGYARAYFTNQINIGTNKKLKQLLLEKFPLEKEQNVLYSNNQQPSFVKEDPAEYNTGLHTDDLKITLKEYINDLREDKKSLQRTIDTNLAAMMQLLAALSRHDRAFHETILKSLGRLEGDNVDLVGEARSYEAAMQIQDSLQGSNVEAGK